MHHQIWGGITWNGPIPFVFFANNLTSNGYEIILKEKSWQRDNSRIKLQKQAI